MKTTVICPNCSDGPLFVVSEGRRVQVKCGHSICQAKEEERIGERAVKQDSARTVVDMMATILAPENFQRLLSQLLRHLPLDVSKGAKRL